MWNVGDNIASKINTIHTGYYTIIQVTSSKYVFRAMERNGTPTFPNDKDKFGVYAYPHNWCHENMILLPPRPPEIQEDEMDFINPLETDW